MFRIRNYLPILGLLFSSSSALFAQFSSNVQGTITDPSGGAVPDAAVVLHNDQTGVDETSTSNKEGFYRFTSVVAGSYHVRVSAPGFLPASNAFTLETQQTLGVNVTLKLANGATQVTVEETVTGVNPDETRLQLTLKGSQLPDLPLPQRSTLAIVQLAPGVVSTNPGQVTSNIPISSQQPAQVANGRPASSNLYRLDGIPISSAQSYGNINLIPAPDMIGETSLQTTTFSAETGSGSSLVVDFTSKSGVNALHGDADITYTSKNLEAHQWNSGQATPFTQKFLSGSLGGAIIKNRTFFFGWAETQIVANSGSGIDTYETDQFYQWAKTALPNSNFVNRFAAYRPTRDQFIQNLKYARDVYPANATSGPACGQASSNFMPCDLPITAQGFFTQSPRLNGTQYNVRLDQYFRDGKDRIFLNYFRVDQTSDFLSPRPAFDSTTPSTTNFAAANWVHTFTPSLINLAQFGWNRFNSNFGGVGTNVWIDTPFIMLECCDGLGFFGYFPPTIDPGGVNNKDHSYRFRDYVSWVKNRHSLRFGFEATHEDYWQDNSAFYARPFVVSYGSFWNMINDKPNSYSLYTISAQTGQFQPQVFGAQVSQFALYVQDEWKLRPNLMLSLGLRWDDYGNPYQYGEHSQPFVQVFPGANNLNTTAALQNALVNTSYTKFVDHAFAGRQNKNFLPRVGVAWTPSKDGKLVIRGGVGLYADALNLTGVTAALPTQPPNRLTLNLNVNNPNLPAPGATPFGTSPVYPYNFNYPVVQPHGFDQRGAALDAAGNLIPASINGTDFSLRPQKTALWNFGIEREVFRGIVAGANYSGSHAWDLFSSPNYNLLAGQALTGSVTGRTTEWGSINFLRNGFESDYHALILTARQTRGRLSWQSSYTWSHALDDQLLGGNLQNLYYASADFDVRHRFSGSGSYQLPSAGNGILKVVTGGWTIGSIVIAQTGTPFSVVTGTDVNGDGAGCSPCDYPNIGPGLTQTSGFSRAQYEAGIFGANSFVNPAVGSTEGNAGRNRFRNPGYLGWDASLIKKTELPWFHDRKASLQLRLELLNVLNRVNLQGVNNQFGNATFGQSTSANLPRYLQLGARFQF